MLLGPFPDLFIEPVDPGFLALMLRSAGAVPVPSQDPAPPLGCLPSRLWSLVLSGSLDMPSAFLWGRLFHWA